jgi:Ca-activated chloride channel homolog
VSLPQRRRLSAGLIGLVSLLLVAACSAPGGAPQPTGSSSPASVTTPGPSATSAAPTAVPPLDSPVTLRVLGSSDLQNMAGVLAAAAQATNVKLDITYVASTAGAKMVAGGKAAGKYDVVWFASNAYLALEPRAIERVTASTKIMTSPVAFGLEPGVARRLGWDKRPPTWAQIAAAASARKFSYAMSNPATSDAAFSTLGAAATALSDGGALEVAEIDAMAPRLRRLFSAQRLTSNSAAELTEAYVKRAGKAGAPDGLVGYESVLMSLNASKKLAKPLTLVVPADGTISADFPMALLAQTRPPVRAAYTALTDWLRSPTGQKMIMDTTSRRPVAAGVAPAKKFGKRMLVELPFPARRPVLDRLLVTYLNSARRETQSIYVLDLSWSMTGSRLEALQSALISLAGGNDEISSSGYAVFRRREMVSLIGYSDRPGSPRTFAIPADNPGPTLARIRRAAEGLEPEGNTATYSALRAAYRLADRQVRANPGALTSIVLMTDGETNRGISAADFRAFYRRLPAATRSVPTFTVKFGTVEAASLARIADLTGGKQFTARGNGLAGAFRQIRAYQ